MSHSADSDQDSASLRQRAEAKLTVGIPLARSRASLIEALAVMHQLASTPATAGDALALLHELQVHQVELDLQQEELSSARLELEAALVRQTALVEQAPVGYMTIDAKTVLREINLAGARLLGANRDSLLARPLSSLLSTPSIDALQALLTRAHDGLAPETCELRLLSPAGTGTVVHAAANKDTLAGCFLLVLMAASPAGPDQAA